MCELVKDHIFVGPIIHSISIDDLQIINNGYIAVKNGKIISVGDASSVTDISSHFKSLGLTCKVTRLTKSQFLMPGFVDCHIHAPQMLNIGLGLGMELLEWLNTYTFPLEVQYGNAEFARKIYNAVVKRTLTCGTTTATYFATIHKQGTLELAEACHQLGQRAFIGKVNMNAQDPPYYREDTKESIEYTKDVIQYILQMGSNLIKPIITPRFALSCDMHLMTELAAIAKSKDLHIQTHISENKGEIQAVSEVYPNNTCYADVYDQAKLLTNKTILAHGIYLEDNELEILRNRGTSIAHCPSSNTNLASGLCNVRKLLKAGLTVGLGTDVSGGSTAMILEVIRRALDVSQHLSLLKSNLNDYPNGMFIDNQTPLTVENAIYLATLGGAEALSVSSHIGNFMEGKDFDAIVADINSPGSPIDMFDHTDSLASNIKPNDSARILNHLNKFILIGDDRNIIKVFVDGRQVK